MGVPESPKDKVTDKVEDEVGDRVIVRIAGFRVCG